MGSDYNLIAGMEDFRATFAIPLVCPPLASSHSASSESWELPGWMVLAENLRPRRLVDKYACLEKPTISRLRSTVMGYVTRPCPDGAARANMLAY